MCIREYMLYSYSLPCVRVTTRIRHSVFVSARVAIRPVLVTRCVRLGPSGDTTRIRHSVFVSALVAIRPVFVTRCSSRPEWRYGPCSSRPEWRYDPYSSLGVRLGPGGVSCRRLTAAVRVSRCADSRGGLRTFRANQHARPPGSHAPHLRLQRELLVARHHQRELPLLGKCQRFGRD